MDTLHTYRLFRKKHFELSNHLRATEVALIQAPTLTTALSQTIGAGEFKGNSLPSKMLYSAKQDNLAGVLDAGISIFSASTTLVDPKIEDFPSLAVNLNDLFFKNGAESKGSLPNKTNSLSSSISNSSLEGNRSRSSPIIAAYS